MNLDDLDLRVRSLQAERNQPIPVTNRDGLDDLRAVIHLLAMALSEGKSYA